MKTYSIDFTCYEVTEPDGGGMRDLSVALFSNHDAAQEFVDKSQKSWPKNIREKRINHTYIVLDSIEEVDQLKKQRLKELALAKLTKEEIEALGL